MSESERLPKSTLSHPVWVALQNYSIGPDDAVLSFAERLARENGWDLDEAERIIGEYKKFCFLTVIADQDMTPSDAIDQVWHLHLSYSRDYWERFCPDILGQLLHHGPTAGGEAEHNRYFEQYAQTLKAYEQSFGEAPPADLWPDARRRLIEDPKARRYHPRDGVVVSRKVAKWLMIAAGLILAAHLFWW